MVFSPSRAVHGGVPAASTWREPILVRLTGQSPVPRRCAPPPYSSTQRPTRPETSKPPSASCATLRPTAPSWSLLPEKWNCSATRDAARRSRAARRPDAHAARAGPASWGSTCSPAASPSGSRAGKALQHLRPHRPLRRTGRRLPQDPHVRRRRRRRGLSRVGPEEPGEEIVTAALGGSLGSDPRADHLLRRSLPRALPDPRRARRPVITRALGVHPRHRQATTGRCCSAPARSRTRRSWSAPTRSARRRRTTAPRATR